MARVFPLPFPPIPKLTNCLASDKHGSCALLCDGGLSVVMDVAAAVGKRLGSWSPAHSKLYVCTCSAGLV